MQGIDFSKNVDSAFPLYYGDEVIQWKNSSVSQGDYYSEKGSAPGCLGIYYLQENRKNDSISPRIEHKFSLVSNVKCLKSYAADVVDTWSITGKSFKVKGGCVQYFNRGDKKSFR
jgi:hypothetical protein